MILGCRKPTSLRAGENSRFALGGGADGHGVRESPRPDLRSYPFGEYVIFFRDLGDRFAVVQILERHREFDGALNPPRRAQTRRAAKAGAGAANRRRAVVSA